MIFTPSVFKAHSHISESLSKFREDKIEVHSWAFDFKDNHKIQV